jgi:hypothetical protein
MCGNCVKHVVGILEEAVFIQSQSDYNFTSCQLHKGLITCLDGANKDFNAGPATHGSLAERHRPGVPRLPQAHDPPLGTGTQGCSGSGSLAPGKVAADAHIVTTHAHLGLLTTAILASIGVAIGLLVCWWKRTAIQHTLYASIKQHHISLEDQKYYDWLVSIAHNIMQL